MAWVEKFCRAPKGAGAKGSLRVRPWQRQLLGCFDRPRPRLVVWSLPRGSGKTTLAAAVALYALHADGMEGARVVLVATDERQARLAFGAARRMTELSEPLAKRTQVYAEKLVVPRTDSELVVLPAERHRLEGLDVSLAVVDEIGFVGSDVFESVLHGTGKRPEGSMVLAIGTPSPAGYRDTSPMFDLVSYGRANPDDPSFALTEYGAPADAAIDDPAVWAAACPGLDDLVNRETMSALLPPKTREAEYRRARLGSWIDSGDDRWLPAGAWEACAEPGPVADGAEVVLALDGSFSQDATALVVATVGVRPHLDVAGLWEPPAGDPEYRVPIHDVEQAVRDACRRWTVREVCADPFRWTRTLQALEAEGLPMVEFPQSPQRMSPATSSMYEAVVNREVTHSGDPRLARHVAAATVRDDARGVRLAKPKGPARRRIDLAVCSVMAHARASHYAHRPAKRRRVFAFR